MKIALLGRTEMLLETGRALAAAGHRIGLVSTCRASGHELAKEDDFEAFAALHGAPFLLGPRLDKPAALAAIAAAECDVALSMNWLTLLPSTVRDQFRHGVFNAHPGDLPRFKGNACPNWAILLGERQVVLALHRMIDQLDAGPVALRRCFPMTEETTIGEVYDWLRAEIPTAYLDLIDRLERGVLGLEPQPSNPELGLRCYPRAPEDGCIDWRQDAETICRLVRASGRPFGGAYTTLKGHGRLTIWKARVHREAEPFVAVPGQVAYGLQGDPVICCASGYLRLLDLELEGGVSGSAAAGIVLSSLRNRLV